MKVYIAGKIAGDPEYKRKFDNAAILLESEGAIRTMAELMEAVAV